MKAIADKHVILPILQQPNEHLADATRILRTNLLSTITHQGLKTIQITSPNQGVGKSTICANLAISFAQAGKRTLLIDANLRQPTLHHVFESTSIGLTDYFNHADLELQATSIRHLSLLTAGNQRSQAADILANEKLHQLLHKVKPSFDLIIIDSPALLETADAQIIAAQVDATALVIQTGKTKKKALAKAKASLNAVNANLIGAILT